MGLKPPCAIAAAMDAERFHLGFVEGVLVGALLAVGGEAAEVEIAMLSLLVVLLLRIWQWVAAAVRIVLTMLEIAGLV